MPKTKRDYLCGRLNKLKQKSEKNKFWDIETIRLVKSGGGDDDGDFFVGSDTEEIEITATRNSNLAVNL